MAQQQGAAGAHARVEVIPFHGNSDEYADWARRFRAYARLQGLGAVLDLDPNAAAPVERDNDRVFSHLLLSLQGRAGTLVQRAREGNGRELWRVLREEYVL